MARFSFVFRADCIKSTTLISTVTVLKAGGSVELIIPWGIITRIFPSMCDSFTLFYALEHDITHPPLAKNNPLHNLTLSLHIICNFSVGQHIDLLLAESPGLARSCSSINILYKQTWLRYWKCSAIAELPFFRHIHLTFILFTF